MSALYPSKCKTRSSCESLLQFRSVSKAWKSLIDSFEFIVAYHLRHAQSERLLVCYKYRIGTNSRYVSFVDDHAFPQDNSTPMGAPMLVDLLSCSRIIGTSLGLFCFYSHYEERGHNYMAVLWNPSIRKSIIIPVPYALCVSYDPVLGFGVCPHISDPKIVRIIKFNITSRRQEVDVYTLSSGIRRTLSYSLPRQSIKVTGSSAVIDRFIYWPAFDTIEIDGRFQFHNLIISFDMNIENLSMVEPPDSLATHRDVTLSICKLKDSLAIVDYCESDKKEVCSVLMMEHGVQKSFTKLFTIQAPHAGMYTLGFRKNGKPTMVMPDYYEEFFKRKMEMQMILKIFLTT